jgi:hypothetical protein
MKIKLFLIIIIICIADNISPHAKERFIQITEDMVIDESGSDNYMSWFDEQDLKNTPCTHWKTSGNMNCWPASIVIDLKRESYIGSIYIFDALKSYRCEGGYLKISAGTPFNWYSIISVPLYNKGNWIKIIINKSTRYLQIQKNATKKIIVKGYYPEYCDIAVNEVIIEGTENKMIEKLPIIVKNKHHVINTMDSFIGMNSYINTPDKVYEAVGCVREYRPWSWNGVSNLKTPIFWGNLNVGNSDFYYKKMKSMGIECIPCIHRHVQQSSFGEQVPSFGGDSLKPETYKLMSDYSFQYVARYGSSKVPDSLLRTTELEHKKSGLGLIKYFENWNEENREWGNPQEHFTPYMFAAFCSASYDGHLGKMGKGFGIKQADKNIKYVMGGLAGLSLGYIKAMKLWADYYRNGSFPADVINLHHYCNTRNDQNPENLAYGISPEEDSLKEKLDKIVKWRDENLPNKEIWLTEIGWDTDPNTYQSAAWGHKLYPNLSMQEIQAEWLIRAYLIASSAGLDRMMIFLANDIKNINRKVYDSCGLITDKGDFKTSWYYIKTMKYALKGMFFEKEIPSGDSKVMVYLYNDPYTEKKVYAIWCPTSDGTIRNSFTLNLLEGSKNAKFLTLEDKKEYGEIQNLVVNNNKVSINVSEKPVFIIQEPEKQSFNIDTSGQFITFISRYYAMSWSKDFPGMSYFNIESGGRNSRYMDKSLLRPGKGGTFVSEGETSFGKPCIISLDKFGAITYKGIRLRDDIINCSIRPQGGRHFFIDLNSESKDIKGEFFRIYTAPNISPVTIWANKSSNKPSTQYDTPISFFTPKITKVSYKLPAILHFPDYGLVKIESLTPDVYMEEHLLPDYDNIGLSLGPLNRKSHVYMKSIHLGSVILSFHSSLPTRKVSLQFTILDENYPIINNITMINSKFDGFKRCWQNAFPVNPETQTMGDNILLDGIGHLSLAYKADMIPFTSDFDNIFSMKDALRTSIEIAFREYIGKNNLINGYGWESTETTLIALYDYLISTNDWSFIYQYISEIRKLVYGILATDTDNDGIFESPFHGNYMTPNRESLNWWDDFAFGNKDAYVNLQAYRALTDMSKVFNFLKDSSTVDTINTKIEKFKNMFDKIFYDPKTKVYAGWISRDNRMHDYMFTFISSMAINEGLVTHNRAVKILKIMLRKLKNEGYDFIYGIPGPLIPVNSKDKGTWDEMVRWGRYENGGLCGQTAYHFIQALYNVGMREKANQILFKMIETFERENTHSGLFPGYLMSVDWRTKGGAPCGYNYLADNYYFLLAVITGYYGIKFPELNKPSMIR